VKNYTFLVLAVALATLVNACDQKQVAERIKIDGIWQYNPRYISDTATLLYETKLGGIDSYIIESDSGFYKHSYDSLGTLIEIIPYSIISIQEIIHKDPNHGLVYSYDVDTFKIEDSTVNRYDARIYRFNIDEDSTLTFVHQSFP